jgi:hypothetical protein
MSHTCWEDEAILVAKPGGAAWELQCPECDDEYYACSRCADGLDWYDNDKGCTCEECGSANGFPCDLHDSCGQFPSVSEAHLALLKEEQDDPKDRPK